MSSPATEILELKSTSIDGLLCVDLEDWHQILLRRFGGGPRHCSVHFRRGLDALLQLLADRNQEATFFVLGMTAAEDSGIVDSLVEAGHEVATHGWAHVHLERRSIADFTEDLRRAVGELTDRSGQPVLGHRAPEFSIPRDNVGAFFDALAEVGITYDSSVYPFAGRRYGLPDFPRRPCRVSAESGEVIEFPLATVELAGRRLPIAGGGYWRLLPSPLLHRMAAKARAQDVLVTTYVHNYEFDPQALRLDEVAEAGELEGSWRRVVLQQNLFRRSLPRKLGQLIGKLRLTSCRTLLEAEGLTPRS